MSTASAVPETEACVDDDDPRALLKKVGYKTLARDTFTRFRAADGLSHARAFAHAAILTGVPALITVIGIASSFELGSFRNVLKQTLNGLAPGPTSQLLTEAFQQGSQNNSILTLAGGLLAALLAATFAMAQIERGCNRIYGMERDRPLGAKLLRALALAVTSGTLLGAAFLTVAAGGVIGDALAKELAWGEAASLLFRAGRWLVGLMLVFGALTLIYRFAPNRQQPGSGWLQTGTTLAAILWICLTGILALYYATNENMSETYGPLLGIIALMTWAYASGVALLLGMALAAQLESIRAGVPGPRTLRRYNETVMDPDETEDPARRPLVLEPEEVVPVH